MLMMRSGSLSIPISMFSRRRCSSSSRVDAAAPCPGRRRPPMPCMRTPTCAERARRSPAPARRPPRRRPPRRTCPRSGLVRPLVDRHPRDPLRRAQLGRARARVARLLFALGTTTCLVSRRNRAASRSSRRPAPARPALAAAASRSGPPANETRSRTAGRPAAGSPATPPGSCSSWSSSPLTAMRSAWNVASPGSCAARGRGTARATSAASLPVVSSGSLRRGPRRCSARSARA